HRTSSKAHARYAGLKRRAPPRIWIRDLSWWRRPRYLVRQGDGRLVLPRPAARELHLQREAQEGADQDEEAKYCHAGKGGLGCDSADDVPGHEQLQAKQDGLAELLAEALVDAGLAAGEPDSGGSG